MSRSSIPNIVHFVFGLSPDFGGRPFSFIHYLAVKSAYECNKPDRIFLHYAYESSGEWWEKARPFLTLHKIEVPTEIFGNPLLHYAHMADVIRLEALLEHGGIYLDVDVVCVRSFAPLLKYPAVMGKERAGGLCNAVILAEKNSEFIRLWHDSYVTFRSRGKDAYWSEHSVEVPFCIAQENPGTIHVVNRHHFFWPTHLQFWLLFGVNTSRSLAERLLGLLAQPFTYLIVRNFSFGVHLYESMWWDRHLKDLNPDKLRSMNLSFGWLFRRYL